MYDLAGFGQVLRHRGGAPVSLDVAVSSELSLVFPTPILLRTLFTGSFNERLARIILGRRRHGEGGRVGGGGWQSGSDLLVWPELEVRLLFAEVVDAVQRMYASPGNDNDPNPGSVAAPPPINLVSINADKPHSGLRDVLNGNYAPFEGRAWANVNGDGHYNPLRVQAGHQWCAIYHVSMGRPAPDRPMNGALQIMDPRPGAPFASSERFAFGQPLEIEPGPGLVVIFPAWLQYCVHPFFGMGHRISITMNVTLEGEQSRR
jgi:hypothetical protein